MIVIPHPEPLFDEVADHRTGPHPRGKPGRLRTRVDHRTQLVALGLSQSGRAARRLLGSETVCACGLEPLKPSIDGASGHIQLVAEGDDRLAGEIAGHRLGPAPGFEVSGLLGFPVQFAKSAALLGRSPSLADCLTIFRPSQDRPLFGRDRGTLILARSSVNQRMDRGRRDPV